MVNGPDPMGISLMASEPTASKAFLLSSLTVVSLMSNSLMGIPQKMSVTNGAFTMLASSAVAANVVSGVLATYRMARYREI